MSDIFISYSRKNLVFARRLFDALQNAGHDTWADWGDIPYSADWWKEICSGIEAANVFVYVISPASLTSMVCNQEVQYARQNNKRIVPLMYIEIDEKQIAGEWFNKDWEPTARQNWTYLKTLNWLFFREQDDFEAAFQSLIHTAEQDPEHTRYHTRLLVRAREWENSHQRDMSLLLRGNDLRQAENWIEFNQSQQPYPTPLQIEYIQTAVAQRQHEEQEEQKRRQRLRSLVTVLSALLLIAILATGIAVNRTQVANSEANERATQQIRAENNAATATNALGREAVALATSEDRGTEVAIQRNTAVAAQATSEQSARESRSLALAASADQALAAGDGDLALALALAANNVENPPSRAQDALIEIAYAQGTIKILSGHELHVLDVAFSPNGQFAVSAAINGRVIVWNIQTGEEVFTIDLSEQLNLDTIQSVTYSPDGTQLLTGAFYHEVSLWDAGTGTLIREFKGHGDVIRGAVFSADGNRILSVSRDGSVILWDAQTGNVIHHLEGHTDNVNQAALSANGHYAATVGDDGLLLLWDLEMGQEVWRYSTPDRFILTVNFSPNGRYLLADHTDHELMLWDVETREEVRRYTQPELASLTSATISPDGSMIAAGTLQGNILLWNFETGTLIHRHVGHKDYVSSVDFSADSHFLLSASHDSLVRLWRVASPLELRQFTQHREVITEIVLSNDGQTVFSASRDHTIIQWDIQTGEVTHSFIGHSAPIQSLAIHPDGQTLLSGDESGIVIEWDIASGSEVRQYEEPDGNAVFQIDYSPDGQLAVFSIYALGQHGTVTGYALWDVEKWEIIRTYIEASASLSAIYTIFSSDGQELITTGHYFANTVDAGPQGYFQYSDVQSGENLQMQIAHRNTIWKIAFSPDNRYFVTASLDNTAILWDADSNQAVRSFVGHTAEVVDVAFSQDGHYVATASRDNRIILWHRATGSQLLELTGHRGGVSAIRFSLNGHYLMSGGPDAVLRLWQTPPPLHELIDWVYRYRYVRELTCDERQSYNVEPFCHADGA